VKRFVEKYESLIEAKKIEEYEAFGKTKKKVKLLKDESKEVEDDKMKELQAQMMQKYEKIDMETYIKKLEEKYALPKKTKRCQKKFEEIPEEELMEIERRLKMGKGTKKVKQKGEI